MKRQVTASGNEAALIRCSSVSEQHLFCKCAGRFLFVSHELKPGVRAGKILVLTLALLYFIFHS